MYEFNLMRTSDEVMFNVMLLSDVLNVSLVRTSDEVMFNVMLLSDVLNVSLRISINVKLTYYLP